MSLGSKLLLSVVSCAIAGASLPGCATPPESHDPGSAASGPVAQVCQNVLGLSPTERLTGGNWLGTDKLDYWTSHYRGCLTSLAGSAQSARDAEVVQQSEQQCRAKGLNPGSADLALCVLQTANGHPEPRGSTSVAPSQPPASAAPGSFYFASAQKIGQREQVACAAVGLSPSQPEFKSCVQDLRATFYAIDHPID